MTEAFAADQVPVEVVEELRRLKVLNAALQEHAHQLQEALDSRVVIEQAKGVLAERLGVPLDEAFAMLRETARRNRIKLRALAAWVVSSPETPPMIATHVTRRDDVA